MTADELVRDGVLELALDADPLLPLEIEADARAQLLERVELEDLSRQVIVQVAQLLLLDFPDLDQRSARSCRASSSTGWSAG